MRSIPVFIVAIVCLVSGAVYAGEVKEIELSDGSVISGEVLSFSNGVYTIRSAGLGSLTLDESKVRAIRTKDAGTAAQGSASPAGDVKTLQNKMMNDKEIMSMIQSLQNDPEFKKILEDPEAMKAVNAGDIGALMANPQFMKLLNHSTVQDIQKKVQQ